MKEIVALYKCYRGGEWFKTSMESVYKQCKGIVAVMSDQPWRRSSDSQPAPENCQEPLAQFRNQHPDYPVTAINPGVRQDTEEQYKTGLSMILSLYGPNVGVLIVDTDEIWDEASLVNLRIAMSRDRRALYFRSGIFTYIRSPLYRVSPKEKARPVVALATPDLTTGKSRFSNIQDLTSADRVKDVQDCNMHHMGYVRLDIFEIMGKLASTSSQDGTKYRKNWMSEVWDNLPSGTDIHPTTKYEHCWGGVEEITMDILPEAIVQSPTFWLTLAHHRGGVPSSWLLADDPVWRAYAEKSTVGIDTTAPDGLALCLSAALSSINNGRTGQDDAIFLTPRLRMSFRETVQLAEHARAIPSSGVGMALEIGSGLGGSISVIGSCCPAITILMAVDPYVPYDEENVTVSRNLQVATVKEFFETVYRLKLVVGLLQCSSEQARSTWKYGNESVDLLLVDGNHSYSHAKYDLEAWWSVLKPGGTLLLHDLSGRFPGVVRAAREFELQTGLRFNLPNQSSLAWLRKPLEIQHETL